MYRYRVVFVNSIKKIESENESPNMSSKKVSIDIIKINIRYFQKSLIVIVKTSAENDIYFRVQQKKKSAKNKEIYFLDWRITIPPIVFFYYIAEPEKIQFQKRKHPKKENLVAKGGLGI